ncbi:MAG: signal peptidase I [Neisseriaceae bacterium]|jgi:conjugative transfer signal peptidase TraF
MILKFNYNQVVICIFYSALSILIALFMVFILSKLLERYIWYNNSISEPIGYYLVYETDQVNKGNTYIISIPTSYMRILKKLGYHANSNTLIKTVVAVSGDTITITNKGVMINKKSLSNSQGCQFARGIYLDPKRVGYTHKLLDNEYWVMGNTSHSYDSRYMGIIPKKLIIRRAIFLF